MKRDKIIFLDFNEHHLFVGRTYAVISLLRQYALENSKIT